MSCPVILCVDDERIILSSLKAQLQNNLSSNFQIEVAESAEEALEIIEELIQENIELPLVIADQIMPAMKGDELLSRVKERLPHTLTIMLTGQASAEAVGKAVNKAGLFRYLSKPWDEDDLVLTIQSALDSYAHQKKLIKQSHYQTVINETLSLALQPLSLEQQLCRALGFLVKVPCLIPPSHAAIYIKHHGPDGLAFSKQSSINSVTSYTEDSLLHFKLLCESPKTQLNSDFSIKADQVNEYLKPRLTEAQTGQHSFYSYPILIDEELNGLIFIDINKGFHLSEEIAFFLSSFSQAISGMYHLSVSNQALRHSNSQLEHHKEKLEQLVLERTEALNEALAKQAEHNAMLQAANKELAYFATTDFLTGLHNRRHFFEQAEQEYKQAKKQNLPCTAAMIDIDHFKRVNDQYGHQTGDELLKKVALTIQQSFDQTVLISRFGGEEFALLLPGMDVESTYMACETLLAQVEKTKLHTMSQTVSATISIGLAACDVDDISVEKSLGRADKALYQAKDNGRNAISIFSRDKA